MTLLGSPTPVRFDGYTARTPLGAVDMVPLLRRMEGDKKAPINESERDAAVFALSAAGVPIQDIQSLLEISWQTATDILSGRRKRAKTELAPLSRQDKNERYRALVQKRRAERVLIDGRLVHPSCEHGKNSSYTGYGCQCTPCSEAHTVARRESYARKKAAA